MSDLGFDRWFAGELTGETKRAFERHLVSCARCREREAAFAGERQAFLSARPWVSRAPTQQEPTPRSRVFAVLAVAVAAAAGVLLANLHAEPSQVRLKGSPHIGFYVTRAGHSERATPNYTLRPGERISFVYSSPRAAYLAIYGVDAGGTVSVYYPAGEVAQRVEAGAELQLDSSVELDDVLGPEQIYAVFCDAAFPLDTLKSTLDTTNDLEVPPEGCRLDRLQWVKAAAP